MTLHFPFFLGTAPIPDVRRLVSERSGNGPRTRPAAISFSSSVSMMSGCLRADARFRAVCGKRGSLYPVETPLSMPASSHDEVQAWSGWFLNSCSKVELRSGVRARWSSHGCRLGARAGCSRVVPTTTVTPALVGIVAFGSFSALAIVKMTADFLACGGEHGAILLLVAGVSCCGG